MKKKIAMMMMALSLTFGVVGVPQTVFTERINIRLGVVRKCQYR